MGTEWIDGRHDLGVTDSAGTMIGMMLAERDNTPVYDLLDGRHLATQFFTGVPSEQYQDPQSELPIIFDDFRAGFGLEVANDAEGKRYYSAINMDMRHKGMAIASPTAQVFSHPDSAGVPKIVNADMETDSSGWAYGTNITYSTDTFQGGVACLKLDADTTTGQYLEGWTAGVQYTFSCYAQSAGTNAQAKIGIDDGHTQTWSSAAPDSLMATPITVQHTVSADSSTCLRLMLWGNYTNGEASFFDTASITMDADSLAVAYSGVTRAFAEHNDKLYYTLDKHLINMDSDGTSRLSWILPANTTDLEPFTDNKLYICQGWDAIHYIMEDSFGSTGCYTSVFDSGEKVKFMQTVHTTQDVMYASDTKNTIRSDSDPSGAAWSGQTTVGAADKDITGLFDKAGALYIPKEDMLYHLDSDGAVQNSLAPRLQALTCSTSGKNALTDGDIIMYPAGDQSLLEIDGTTLTWRDPSNYCTNLSTFVGRVQALAYDDKWWYAIVGNGNLVEVMAGRLESIDGTVYWVWHPIAEIPMTNCETAFVSNIYKKRLYVAPATDSDSLYYIDLPIGYGNIASDANRYFVSDGYFITPWQHGGFKGDDKAWIKATATLGHSADTDVYFELHYQKKGDSEWTDVGDFKGTSTNRKPTLYLPVDSDSANPVSPMMRFMVVAKTDDPDLTPILENLDVRSILYPTRKSIIACTVDCSDSKLDNTGDKISGYLDIKRVLDFANDEATFPVAIKDFDGSDKYVKFLPLPAGEPRWTVKKSLKGENPELLYKLLMQIVPMS